MESPPLRRGSKDKDGEGELEIDLESLGLEDKEIPPDKLVKLEKIGSGGFKEYVLSSSPIRSRTQFVFSVYVGRLRGRVKVAIAEFRGQLSASGYFHCIIPSSFQRLNNLLFCFFCRSGYQGKMSERRLII